MHSWSTDGQRVGLFFVQHAQPGQYATATTNKWRTGIAVHRRPCVAMCLTQQFPLERIMVDEGLWGVAMGREVWDGIKKHAVELTKE